MKRTRRDELTEAEFRRMATKAAMPLEMARRDHLLPGWQPANRPAKQKWASWVRTFKPMSKEGKAAKAYSYGPVSWGWTPGAKHQAGLLPNDPYRHEQTLASLSAFCAAYPGAQIDGSWL